MRIALFIVVTPFLALLLGHGYFGLLQRIDYGDFDSDRRVLAWILAVGSMVLLWMLFLT
jgi:hypothetical protein